MRRIILPLMLACLARAADVDPGTIDKKVLLGYQGWVTEVFYGGVLVAAVAASAYLQRRRGS